MRYKQVAKRSVGVALMVSQAEASCKKDVLQLGRD